jgi:hypothetical protein
MNFNIQNYIFHSNSINSLNNKNKFLTLFLISILYFTQLTQSSTFNLKKSISNVNNENDNFLNSNIQNEEKGTDKGLNAADTSIHTDISLKTDMNNKLTTAINTFLTYYDEYSKISIIQEHLDSIKQKSKINSPKTHVEADTIYAYYIPEKHEMEFTEKEVYQHQGVKVAIGTYDRTRYQTGWDKLHIKTFSTANPLIQCWTSGFIEGVLSAEEIYFYYKNIHVFFHKDPEYIKDIKDFYAKIDMNIRTKISPSFFKKLQETIITDNKGESKQDQFTHWSYITCMHAQLNGLYQGYNTIADKDKKLDILDFYFINSEGNFGDLKTFMKINKMKIDLGNNFNFSSEENLKKVYNTSNIEKIWRSLTRKGHCSALVKLIKDPKTFKYDLLSGHNTWTEYCEMMRVLKYKEYEFEPLNNSIVGMKPKSINFSSYPGVLFSGDDFYLIDNKVTILQTTLSALNKFVYKGILNLDNYIPEFMRIMITNLISNSGKEWVENYKSYKNHMYITQWTILDYNVLDQLNASLNNLKVIPQGMVYLLEEVPGSILSKDITNMVIKDSYFGSFNLPYFPQHMQILGLREFVGVDFTSKEYNPRYFILKNLHSMVNTLDDFTQMILYNGFRKKKTKIPNDPSFSDPSNGICSRDDLAKDAEYHGGVDFKVVNSELVNKMTILAYGGPTYDDSGFLPPFDFHSIRDYHKDYHMGIPDKWDFQPIYFSLNDFQHYHHK